MTTIRITQLIRDVDMRPTRALIDGRLKLFTALARGQIALLVNRACTMARFVDCEKTVHTMWAPAGEKFDINTIEEMVKKRTLAIGVDVVRNRKAVKPRHVVSLARERRSA